MLRAGKTLCSAEIGLDDRHVKIYSEKPSGALIALVEWEDGKYSIDISFPGYSERCFTVADAASRREARKLYKEVLEAFDEGRYLIHIHPLKDARIEIKQ